MKCEVKLNCRSGIPVANAIIKKVGKRGVGGWFFVGVLRFFLRGSLCVMFEEIFPLNSPVIGWDFRS